jgi:hypothetical protein
LSLSAQTGACDVRHPTVVSATGSPDTHSSALEAYGLPTGAGKAQILADLLELNLSRTTPAAMLAEVPEAVAIG